MTMDGFKTRPANRPFDFRNTRLMAVPLKDGMECCQGCFFNDSHECTDEGVFREIGSCCAPNRLDHKDVVFVEVRKKRWEM